MTQTPHDLDRLRALAKAVELKQWTVGHTGYIVVAPDGDDLDEPWIIAEMAEFSLAQTARDHAAYIAAAQPSTVLWMIERIRELEGWR